MKRIVHCAIALSTALLVAFVWLILAMPTQANPPEQGAGGAPRIPHPLQGRDNCLACHGTGIGGAPVLNSNHSGRTNEMCRGCHQPVQTEEPALVVPTLVPHIAPTLNQDTCVDCHTQLGGASVKIVQDYKSSIHADRNVFCVDCHGGDPTKTTKEEAMSTKAGFIGKPKTVDIPALCASCHSRVELMRQYDVPTDQWAKYLTSVHGRKLAQGDTKVATCFTCHDGHGTKKTNDPSAKVYSLNVPALCGSCHSDAAMMSTYGIPTNQYDLYKQSVHGIALLEKQDTRAPSCATCHGTHGAAPPGFDEVSNVCGSCHTATQAYYLQSKHASGATGTPKCVTCHGRYDVGVPSETMFVGNTSRDCTSCHATGSPQAQTVKDIYNSLFNSANKLDQAQRATMYAGTLALITAPEDVKIAQAKTNLITARAAQHTLNLKTIQESTGKADTMSQTVISDAEKAVGDSFFRREVMGVGLAIMALSIISLWFIRREVYKRLPPE